MLNGANTTQSLPLIYATVQFVWNVILSFFLYSFHMISLAQYDLSAWQNKLVEIIFVLKRHLCEQLFPDIVLVMKFNDVFYVARARCRWIFDFICLSQYLCKSFDHTLHIIVLVEKFLLQII